MPRRLDGFQVICSRRKSSVAQRWHAGVEDPVCGGHGMELLVVVPLPWY